MNDHFNYLINSRTLTTFSPCANELQLKPNKNYLFDLSYLAVLTLQGEKAVEFLQGQLTADVNKATDIQMIQAAQCNLKGRILALMDVINWNGIKLVLPQDILESTQASLAKTALLSRVSIKSDESFALFGFYLQNPDDLIPNSVFLPKDLYAKAQGADFCYYHLGDGFYVFLVEKNAATELSQPFVQEQQILGSLSWHTLRLRRKQLSIYPKSRGLFLPHRVDLQQTPYLSFDKGCYKGQEIIARTHYRATIKHELRLYTLNTEQPLFSGQKLFKEHEDIEIGELIDYSVLDTNSYLIAVSILKEASLEAHFEQHNELVTLLKV